MSTLVAEEASTTTAPTWRRVRPAWVLVGLFVVLAIIGPWVVPYDPVQPDPLDALSPPSAAHWFGTDSSGFDVFSRVIAATRVDFFLALIGVLIGGGLGSLAGALVAYRGGWLDTVALRIVEVLQSFPVLLLGLALFAALGGGQSNLVLVIVVVNFPLYLRQVRSEVLPLREAEFVLAAQCAGLGSLEIAARHLLPNARSQIVSLFALTCAYGIQIIAGLSFVGLGIEPPNPEWGAMINAGASYIVQGIWWPSVFPGLAIVLVVAGLSGLTDADLERVGVGT